MRSSFRIASILFIVAAGAVPSIEAADNREGEIATTLTVRWPAPLSKNLTESAVIEGFLDKFLVRN